MTLSPASPSARPRAGWTFAIVSVALFMVTLDNLVVSTALPTIRVDLGASLESLEWTVNAYTLAFAVLLLTGAALGDRFGRRRMFGIGIGLFTLSSAAAALAPSTDALVAARAAQGLGAAIVLPLTLTLLSAAVPVEKRGLALGAWSGISGLGVALGPVVGGAVVDGISWHWIFWINVPIGLALVPLSRRFLSESYGPAGRLDLPGIGLAGAGLLAVVYGIVRGEALGWTSPTIVATIGVGLVLVAAFLAWEHRAPAPMLPLRFFRSRAFSATNATSLAMFFGVFGSIFLLSQFFQTTQGLSPLQSGLRVLPWTIMPIFIAPIAGLAERSHRRAAADGVRARAAGDRDRLAGRGDDADGGLLVAAGAVRPGGRRDGAGLRAGGQRGPRLGQAGGGRPGLGRDQRDPRARRRPRRGDPRERLHRQRRLRVAAGLRGRDERGAADRRRRPRRGRAAGAADPGKGAQTPRQSRHRRCRPWPPKPPNQRPTSDQPS